MSDTHNQQEQDIETDLPVGLPDRWAEWPADARAEYIEVRLTRDELYDAIVESAGLSPKENTGSAAFRKFHLAELLVHLRGEDDD